MTLLHQITNPDKELARRVNFFADYYSYCIYLRKKSLKINLENHLSLVEKILFQLEYNFPKSNKYITSYLYHTLFNKNNKYFKEYKNHKKISDFFELYKKEKDKKKWLEDNKQEFIQSLKTFRTELRRYMFKRSVDKIIECLINSKRWNKNQNDIIYHTNLIVTEIGLKKMSTENYEDIFDLILNKDIVKFPYPRKLLDSSKDEKKYFLDNLNFEQQFKGIYNYYTKGFVSNFFILKVNGIISENEFKFKYNKVKFINPKHPDLIRFMNLVKINDKYFYDTFYEKNNVIFAVIKIKYKNKKDAEYDAVNIINTELNYLNNKLGANAYLEKFSYITTLDYEQFSRLYSNKEQGSRVGDIELKRLKFNSFNELRQIKSGSKTHFLKYENLYNNAVNSKLPSDYWFYLETVLSSFEKDEIIEVVSSIVMLNNTLIEKEILKLYVHDALLPYQINCESIGISFQKQREYNSLNFKSIDLEDVSINVKNDFFNYILNLKNEDSNSFKDRIKFYLLECYAMRNSYVHDNKMLEESLIQIELFIPEIISRFRNVIIDNLKIYNENNFKLFIDKILLLEKGYGVNKN